MGVETAICVRTRVLNAHVTPFPEASKTAVAHTQQPPEYFLVAPKGGFLQRR